MLNLPMAQSSTGAEYRAASAVDIALWDIFGKVCGQPVHQMLGGLCRERHRIYNTCAGYTYVRSQNIKPVSNWRLGESRGPYEDLDGFMNRADAVAESLLESGITAMKIWPFDPAAIENHGLYITAAQMKTAIEPFEKIRKAVGDRIEIMVEFHSLWNLPAAKLIARALEPYKPTWYEDPIRMNSPQALAEYARSTDVWVCASETLGSRFAYKELLEPRCRRRRHGRPVLDRRPDGGPQDRALAETCHRPFAPHDCTGPVGFVAAVHASFSQPNTLIQEIGPRLLQRLVHGGARHRDAAHQGGYVYPMEAPGLVASSLPAVFERPDLTVRRSALDDAGFAARSASSKVAGFPDPARSPPHVAEVKRGQGFQEFHGTPEERTCWRRSVDRGTLQGRGRSAQAAVSTAKTCQRTTPWSHARDCSPLARVGSLHNSHSRHRMDRPCQMLPLTAPAESPRSFGSRPITGRRDHRHTAGLRRWLLVGFTIQHMGTIDAPRGIDPEGSVSSSGSNYGSWST